MKWSLSINLTACSIHVQVSLGSSLFTADYSWLFQQMTDKVAENIEKPGYVSLLRPDFSTTSPEHLIVAQVRRKTI